MVIKLPREQSYTSVCRRLSNIDIQWEKHWISDYLSKDIRWNVSSIGIFYIVIKIKMQNQLASIVHLKKRRKKTHKSLHWKAFINFTTTKTGDRTRLYVFSHLKDDKFHLLLCCRKLMCINLLKHNLLWLLSKR